MGFGTPEPYNLGTWTVRVGYLGLGVVLLKNVGAFIGA